MGKIVYLMGKSSSGKDTVYRELLKDPALGLKKIVPYTTRPIREGEVNGKEYFFTDEEGFQKLKKDGKIIEDREYETYYGLWRYFTVDDERLDLLRYNYLMIGTLESCQKMADHFGKEKLLPILLEVDDGIRLQRALDREKAQKNPKYQELCRRYLADEEDFAEVKIKEINGLKRFSNENLESCIKELEKYIAQAVH